MKVYTHHLVVPLSQAAVALKLKNVLKCFGISKVPYKCCYAIKPNISEAIWGSFGEEERIWQYDFHFPILLRVKGAVGRK